MATRLTGGGVELRRAHPGVTLEQLQQAAWKNGHDEVVFQAADGQLYLAIGRDLEVEGQRPTVGDTVELAGQAGTVVYSEHELNRRKLGAWLGAAGIAAGTGGAAYVLSTVGVVTASAASLPVIGPIAALIFAVPDFLASLASASLAFAVGTSVGAGLGVGAVVSADRDALHGLSDPVTP